MTTTTLKEIMISDRTPFVVPLEHEVEAVAILRGRYAARLAHATTRVRRVLDIGAGVGAFACWAFRRWPGAWIDMVEYDGALAAHAVANAPPGARLLMGGDMALDAYDVVRIGAALSREELAGILPVLSEVPIWVLDRCEVIK